MLLQELSWNAKKLITSLPFFLDSFIGFPSRNRSAIKLSLPLTSQFMITPPSTSLISKNTTLLAFSDQHLDLSLMSPGPGIPRQSGTASEPSDMLLPPSGMSYPRASRRRTPFSLLVLDLCWKHFYLPRARPRDDSQCDCVCALALVCVQWSWCCHNQCMCVWFFSLSVIIICNSVYIFTFNCYVYSIVPLLGRGGWVGAVCTCECPLVVLACESLHVHTCNDVCTVCIWCCEHARFCVEVFYALYNINFHSFIHYLAETLNSCAHCQILCKPDGQHITAPLLVSSSLGPSIIVHDSWVHGKKQHFYQSG